MPQYRQLAAIMFTDIAGYTALMGEDESKAFKLLRMNRQIQQPLVQKYNGRWIKELGDGVLTSFNTVTDAIQCAILIQEACNTLPDLKLRIGIHLGEVLFENNDVFGDGVNIASRIQAIAPVGRIWISEAVYNNIANNKSIQSHFVKQEILKNVRDPVRIYELDVNQKPFIISTNNNISLNPAKKVFHKSIAVLPFVNMSNDPTQEYFSDGIAEEIINALSHLKDLKVAGRTSSFQFKDTRADLRNIGEKLGVNNVLEGSVKKQGDRVRITARLVNVEDGYDIWSERYDRSLEDIFSIQDEIALAITEKLKITLMQNDRDRITKSFTQNSEAYELYLKGKFYINRRGASIILGMQHFQKAIDIDPEFPLPLIGYADANLLMATYGLAPPKIVLPKAKQSAEKALELDPTLSEPYCLLGLYYTFFDRNWAEAKKYFLRSLELNPKYSDGHFRYGWNFLSWVEGNFEEAEKHGAMAIRLEPLSAICYGAYSLILHTSGKYKEALAICQSGIDIDPNSFLCRVNEGSIYTELKEYDKAIVSYKIALSISNRHHFAINGLIRNYCLMGDIDKALPLMNEIKERSAKEYIANTFNGVSAFHLNNIDEAFDYLEKAYNDYDPLILTIKYESWFPEHFKSDARFQALLEKIKFPPEKRNEV
jgi:TolB-like protein/class 3 adenylate cyclase/Tfp pilus assembly protein PilF